MIVQIPPVICAFDYDTVNVQESGLNDFFNALRLSVCLEGAPPPPDASYHGLKTSRPFQFTPQSDLADQCQRMSKDWRELKECQARHVAEDTRSVMPALSQRVFVLEAKSGATSGGSPRVSTAPSGANLCRRSRPRRGRYPEPLRK
jgi:hypothetical protein